MTTFLSAFLWSSAGAQVRRPRLFEETGRLRSKAFSESSGVAVSHRFEGLLWTHNDSGDGPYIYATNLEGRYLGRFRVRDARNVDWEDIALASCPGAEGDCLYIADTGDNDERRKDVSIYIVREPDIGTGAGDHGKDGKTERAHRIRFTYPGGARDVEALAVLPNGDLLLVSKGRDTKVETFVIPADSLALDRTTALRLQTLPIRGNPIQGRWVTGAALAPDGKRVALRTYTELYIFALEDNDRLVQEGTACWLGAREPQGEAIDFLDDSTMVLTSESVLNHRGTVFRVRC